MEKVSWNDLVSAMVNLGWSVADLEDERSRQYYEELDKRPAVEAGAVPLVIHDDAEMENDYWLATHSVCYGRPSYTVEGPFDSIDEAVGRFTEVYGGLAREVYGTVTDRRCNLDSVRLGTYRSFRDLMNLAAWVAAAGAAKGSD